MLERQILTGDEKLHKSTLREATHTNLLAVGRSPSRPIDSQMASQQRMVTYVLTWKKLQNEFVQAFAPHTVTSFAPHNRVTSGGYRKKNAATHYSHVRMLLSCMEEDASPCLIFEDDISFVPHIWASVQAIMKERPDHNLIMLGTNLKHNRTVVDVQKHSAILRHTGNRGSTGGGCHAYLVRDPQKLIQALLARPKPSPQYPNNVCVELLDLTDIVVARESLAWQTQKLGSQEYCIQNNASILVGQYHLDNSKGFQYHSASDGSGSGTGCVHGRPWVRGSPAPEMSRLRSLPPWRPRPSKRQRGKRLIH